MFKNCSSLKKLDISNFNTNNTNNMDGMFFECSSLNDLKIPDLNNMVTMREMFYHCSEILIMKIKKNKNIKDEAFINGNYYID